MAIPALAGLLVLIVVESKINKRLVFFSSAVRSGIFTGVTVYGVLLIKWDNEAGEKIMEA